MSEIMSIRNGTRVNTTGLDIRELDDLFKYVCVD